MCFTQGGGFQCPVGLKIPTNFVGQLTIEIGRPAKVGETYEIATDAFAPGEVLHCSGVRGKTVTEALPLLAAHGVNPIWRAIEEGDAVQEIDPATIADDYVVDHCPTVTERCGSGSPPNAPTSIRPSLPCWIEGARRAETRRRRANTRTRNSGMSPSESAARAGPTPWSDGQSGKLFPAR